MRVPRLGPCLRLSPPPSRTASPALLDPAKWDAGVGWAEVAPGAVQQNPPKVWGCRGWEGVSTGLSSSGVGFPLRATPRDPSGRHRAGQGHGESSRPKPHWGTHGSRHVPPPPSSGTISEGR